MHYKFIKAFFPALIIIICNVALAQTTPTFSFTTPTGTIRTCAGIASANYQQFTVSGRNLTGDIKLVIPPVTYVNNNSTQATTQQAWEMTTTPNNLSTFGYTLNIHPVNGQVDNVTIYVRMGADNLFPQWPASITISTDGADASQTVYITGTQVPLAVVDAVNQTICNNTSTQKMVFTGTGTGYSWTNDKPEIGLAASGTGDIPPFVGTNSTSEPLRANITVTPLGECTGTPHIFHITVNPTLQPSLNVSADKTILCPGEVATFTAIPLNVGDLPIYKWLVNGQTTGGNSISGDNTLTFVTDKLKDGDQVTCTVTGSTYCYMPYTSTPITIKTAPLPEIHFSSNNYNIYPSQSVTLLSIANTDITSYSWKPTTGLNHADIPNPTASPAVTTTYQLTATEAGGCTATANVTVTVLPKLKINLDIPNTFTPNGDGVHDTWEIPKLADFPQSTIKVYTRYGSLIYQSVGYTKSWDGTYQNQKLVTGTYYYVIDLKIDEPLFSGFVYILR
ncbi:gliding motility-associated C-terminal domain-containing protein [Mucilaginibacter agri]|uniref:T9SS type B sorting domain-containing protein n=1 Tax=Mucilaginibacter agri TaxID=2695265 RepID=A0A965ZG42_9SPHI|nr:gliding motility-associated C-terminal domain-containing protein [Mucilaginibacter agri]NCD70413.1 T9SS type B sorting domain-containing protein [Mucilaginibacter agri]